MTNEQLEKWERELAMEIRHTRKDKRIQELFARQSFIQHELTERCLLKFRKKVCG